MPIFKNFVDGHKQKLKYDFLFKIFSLSIFDNFSPFFISSLFLFTFIVFLFEVKNLRMEDSCPLFPNPPGGGGGGGALYVKESSVQVKLINLSS